MLVGASFGAVPSRFVTFFVSEASESADQLRLEGEQLQPI